MLLVRALLILLSVAPCVWAMPTIIVDSGKAKCFQAEAPQDTVIRVSYWAPDMPLDKQEPNYAPTFISINVRPATRVLDTKLHASPILNRLKPTNKLLEEREGSIEHKIEVDGTASICIRASGANGKRPMRFGIRVVKTANDTGAAKAGSGTELDRPCRIWRWK